MIRLLNAIYKLGKLYLEKEGLNEFEVLLDNKNIGAVLSIDLIEDEFLRKIMILIRKCYIFIKKDLQEELIFHLLL